MKEYTTVGIDLAKRNMHFLQLNYEGKEIGRKKVTRDELIPELSKFDKSTVMAMEACSTSNHWGRELKALGYTVKLMKPRDVKAFALSRQKNDMNDAMAIGKAARDPELRVVRVKTQEEQSIKLLHSFRETTISERIRKTNALKAYLCENGYFTELKAGAFPGKASEEVSKANAAGCLDGLSYDLLNRLGNEIGEALQREKEYDKKIREFNKTNARAKKFLKIRGIGPVNASYLSMMPIDSYDSGRDFAASLGLVPSQHSSGDKQILGKITKQGDRYGRKLLIQAARTIAMKASAANTDNIVSDDALIAWAQKKLKQNKPFNLVSVGLANKLARIVYAIVMNESEYSSTGRSKVA